MRCRDCGDDSSSRTMATSNDKHVDVTPIKYKSIHFSFDFLNFVTMEMICGSASIDGEIYRVNSCCACARQQGGSESESEFRSCVCFFSSSFVALRFDFILFFANILLKFIYFVCRAHFARTRNCAIFIIIFINK